MAVPGVSSSSCGAASPASPSSGRLYKHAGLTQKIRREQGKRQQSLFCNGKGLRHQVTGCSSRVGFRLLSTPCLSGSIPPMSQGARGGGPWRRPQRTQRGHVQDQTSTASSAARQPMTVSIESSQEQIDSFKDLPPRLSVTCSRSVCPLHLLVLRLCNSRSCLFAVSRGG